MIRCSCLYRASTPQEQSAGAAALAVSVRDPFCPADALHARAAQPPKPPAPPPTPASAPTAAPPPASDHPAQPC